MYNYLKRPRRNLLYTSAVPPKYSAYVDEAERAAAVAEKAAAEAIQAAEVGNVATAHAAATQALSAYKAVDAIYVAIRSDPTITPDQKILEAHSRSYTAYKKAGSILGRAERAAVVREGLSPHLPLDIIANIILPYRT